VGELRAILLGISVGCLALIWWWTARNSRQARGGQSPGARTGAAQTGAVDEPVLEPPLTAQEPGPEREPELAGAELVDRDWGVSPLEPLSIKTADFDRVPILEMPMMADVKATAGLGDETLEFSNQTLPVLTQVAEPVSRPIPQKPARTTAPSPRTAPARVPAAPPPPARTDDSDRFAPPEPRSPNASERQRIVTVRVCAVGDARWTGGQLIAALESQGLAFGKYNIYHRRHADGRSLFCVASLIEPGTFDVAQMPNQDFRGLSLFAVLPGPAEPLQTIDALLTTARGLAEELTAMVEDAQGLPLSPLRAAALREDIARFQAQLA